MTKRNQCQSPDCQAQTSHVDYMGQTDFLADQTARHDCHVRALKLELDAALNRAKHAEFELGVVYQWLRTRNKADCDGCCSTSCPGCYETECSAYDQFQEVLHARRNPMTTEEVAERLIKALKMLDKLNPEG